MCVTGSLPRSLKQEVSRTNAEALLSTEDTVSLDTGDNVGLNTGEIDVAGRDSRSIRCGRYMDDIDVVVATLIAAVTFQLLYKLLVVTNRTILIRAWRF